MRCSASGGRGQGRRPCAPAVCLAATVAVLVLGKGCDAFIARTLPAQATLRRSVRWGNTGTVARLAVLAVASTADLGGDDGAWAFGKRRGTEEAEARRRRAEEAEAKRKRSEEWFVTPGAAVQEPWELRKLSPAEQATRLNRGLASLSTTFGWCMTDADSEELAGLAVSLEPKLDYLTEAERVQVFVALEMAYHAHQGQRRKSGESFISHPVAVTLILAGLGMDAETLVAGLLHDTVEDTCLGFHHVEDVFGSTVARIVEGETKVSKIPGRVSVFTATAFAQQQAGLEAGEEDAPPPVVDPASVKQADNLRHMLIAMSKDWRVLAVKLADRLHNMRTLGAMAPEKQERIAQETMTVFVPLARRMGLWAIKCELEDLCFRTMQPEEYAQVARLVEQRTRVTRHSPDVLEQERLRLQAALAGAEALRGASAASLRVEARTKPVYSAWRAMQRNGGSFLRVLDVVSFHVTFCLQPGAAEDPESWEFKQRGKAACYSLLEEVHTLLPPASPMRVKDYIAFPKANGYTSLHTTVFLHGYPVEIQIRTEWMDRVAKGGMTANQLACRASEEGWDRSLDWLMEVQTSAEANALGCSDAYSASVRESLSQRRFVFTPQGNILDLVGNATVLDAAREMHDAQVSRVVAAKVNSRMVPLTHVLSDGDVVSVITAPWKTPSSPVLPAKPPRPPRPQTMQPLGVGGTADSAAAAAAAAAAAGAATDTADGGSRVDSPDDRHIHVQVVGVRDGVWPWNLVGAQGVGGQDREHGVRGHYDSGRRPLATGGGGGGGRAGAGGAQAEVRAQLREIEPVDRVQGDDDGDLAWYREAEIKHGRMSMLAVVAWINLEIWRLLQSGTLFGAVATHAHDSPLVFLYSMSPTQVIESILGIGLLEFVYGVYRTKTSGDSDRQTGAGTGLWPLVDGVLPPRWRLLGFNDTRRGGVVGGVGGGGGVGNNVGGDDRRGLDLSEAEKAQLAAQRARARQRELQQARLAMLALLAMGLQSWFSGEDALGHVMGLW